MGGRHHHHPGRLPLRHDRRDAQRQDHRTHRSTGIGRPRFWSARATTTKKSGRARWTPPKWPASEADGDDHENTGTCTGPFSPPPRSAAAAWVFIYPMLSGEKKAETARLRSRAGTDRQRQVDKTQRSRREQVEGTLKDLRRPAQGKQEAAQRPPDASRRSTGRPRNSGWFRPSSPASAL